MVPSSAILTLTLLTKPLSSRARAWRPRPQQRTHRHGLHDFSQEQMERRRVFYRYPGLSEELRADGLLLRQTTSGDVSSQDPREQVTAADHTLWRTGLRLKWGKKKLIRPAHIFCHQIFTAATSLAHVGRVAVEQVVSHAQDEMLQFVPEKWDGRKLAVGEGRVEGLLAPRHDRGRRFAAAPQVELLHLLHAVFGRGHFFIEETCGGERENKNYSTSRLSCMQGRFPSLTF